MRASPAARTILQRIDVLATFSESVEGITRRYLTPEHKSANEMVARWMEEAGMATAVDAAGNIVGRYEGTTPGLPAIVIGSHLDTVPNAGRFDGILGVVTGIACVDRLHQGGVKLPYAIEVVGFGDEEGARFHTTYLGSRAFANTFDSVLFTYRDRDGITVAEAMTRFGLDPDKVSQAGRCAEEVHCYLELHIEQGPILERNNLPVGIVSGINGQSRLNIKITGRAGHAGTVPMRERHDALAASAQTILAIEEICGSRAEQGVVGTVGDIAPQPGAPNVIAGSCTLTLDLRAPDDHARHGALDDIRVRLAHLALRRQVKVELSVIDEKETVRCSPWLIEIVTKAAEDRGIQPMLIGSGAGHDAAVMASLTDIGMIFVRCRGGVSHNPEEDVALEDIEAGLNLLQRTLLRISEENRR
jgi:allantoate deiminase